MLEERIERHRAFWEGKGPSLILIPAFTGPQYDTDDYPERFENPQLMWEAEMRRARTIVDWPTDGIPTVRPNLGVIFIPGIVGQNFEVKPEQMPWPGDPLSREEIRRFLSQDIETGEMMARARRFYEIHRASGEKEVLAYQPDTQGIFSLAHLFYGDKIFTDLAEDPGWVRELMDITATVHYEVVRALKTCLGEADGEMAHGHSSPNGVYFPNAGRAHQRGYGDHDFAAHGARVCSALHRTGSRPVERLLRSLLRPSRIPVRAALPNAGGARHRSG